MSSTSAPILIHHPSPGRIKFIPALHFAIPMFCGWLMVLFTLFYPATPACAQGAVQPLSVTIVQSEGGGSYGEFSDALRKMLGKSGLGPTVIDSSDPIPNSGLIIAVGLKAATVAAASDASAVLNVFISKASHEKLLHDFPLRTYTSSAIFLDQPIHRQVALIGATVPDKKNVGLLYSPPPFELAKFKGELIGHGLKLQEQIISPALPLAMALQELLLKSNVLLVLPDAEVYNSSTIRNILLAAFRSNVPLIGISSGYVKAGALSAVISTPVQIAAQAATAIQEFRDTRTLPAAQYPMEFEVIVNEQVARSLGLQIKSPAELRNLIGAKERNTP